MSKAVARPASAGLIRRSFGCTHFFKEATGGEGFAVAGTTAVKDGGGISNATAASDNAEASVASDAKLFKYSGADNSAQLRWLVDFTEANTDDANVYVGMHSATIADTLGDDEAGPPANYSGFGFFKLSGNTTWSIEASNATSQTTVELSAANSLTAGAQSSGGGTRQLLGIDVIGKTATKADIVFTIDEVAVYKLTDFDMTSIAACALVAFMKASGANAETLNTYAVDFWQNQT